MSEATTSGETMQVICLCAQWCGACREWRGIFDAAARAHPALHFAWIDVEDEADAMGDVDIETFPTMLIARAGQPLFFGPIQPSGAQLSRLIESLSDANEKHIGGEAGTLLARLAPLLLQKR